MLGIHIGPGGSMVIGNHEQRKTMGYNIGPHFSYTAGFTFQYKFTPKLALNIEANLENKGHMFILPNVVSGNPNNTGNEAYLGTTRTEYIQDYITLPVMLKLSLNKQKVSWFGNIGVYNSYLLRSGWRNHPKHAAPEVIHYEDLTNIHAFKFGLVTSVGAYIPIKDKLQFAAELRQNTQFGNIIRTNLDETVSLLFSISYKIH